MKRKILILVTLVTLMIGCETVIPVLNMILCKYKVDSVSDPTWAGINFAKIKQVSDISLADGLKVTQAILNKDYQLKFNFNMLAANQTENPAQILGFDYRFLLDDTELTTGTSTQQYSISPGNSITIPIAMELNVKDFVSGETIAKLINLTTHIVNYGKGDPSNVKMQIAPYVPFGNETKKMPYITLNHTLQ